MSLPPAWIAVGRITRAHGVKGEVAVHVLTEVGSRFDPGEKVYLEQDESRPLRMAGDGGTNGVFAGPGGESVEVTVALLFQRESDS